MDGNRSSATSARHHIAQIGSEAFDRCSALHNATDKEALYGLRTGLADLDHVLTGHELGHLLIVAARPSMGEDLPRTRHRTNVLVLLASTNAIVGDMMHRSTRSQIR